MAKDAYPWHLSNRNKRGMAVDLKSQGAAMIVERLVKWADVLIVNTPHPARKKLGLEYEDVVAWNPSLIYANLTGFGENGPDANLPGFDMTAYWARSSLLAQTRDAGAPRPGRSPAAAITRPRSGSSPRSSWGSTGANPQARAPMSPPRSSPRACGPPRSRSRAPCACEVLRAARSQVPAEPSDECLPQFG